MGNLAALVIVLTLMDVVCTEFHKDFGPHIDDEEYGDKFDWDEDQGSNDYSLIKGHQDADALYAFKGRGFGGEIGVVTANTPLAL